jgi:hypothetical protein
MSAFDAETLPTWQDNFKTLDELSKSWVLGECFLLCLIAKQVSPSLIKGDKFGQVGLMRLQGGGGRVLIADELNHQVYGEVPRLPLDAHKFTKSTKDILMGGFS